LLYQRLGRGWSVKRAFTTPVKKKRSTPPRKH
jgi:hypothetical protein